MEDGRERSLKGGQERIGAVQNMFEVRTSLQHICSGATSQTERKSRHKPFIFTSQTYGLNN
jgi:hypothetical protein